MKNNEIFLIVIWVIIVLIGVVEYGYLRSLYEDIDYRNSEIKRQVNAVVYYLDTHTHEHEYEHVHEHKHKLFGGVK